MAKFRSYDDYQLAAKRKTCRGCKRDYFFTRHGRVLCMWCRKAAK